MAPAYGSIRQHTSAYVSIRQHTSAYVSIRLAYVSTRQHTSVSIRVIGTLAVPSASVFVLGRGQDLVPRMLTCADVAARHKHLHRRSTVGRLSLSPSLSLSLSLSLPLGRAALPCVLAPPDVC